MKDKVNRQTNANCQEKNHLFARQSIDKKVQHLLSRMTLEEKIAQLGSVWIYEILEGNSFSQGKAKKLMKHGIGQVTRLGGASNFSPVESARIANKIQKFLLKDTRLGIPAIIHEESCCGYMAKGATCFPQAIGVASTWQPELVKEMAVVIREQMKSVGAHQALAPVLDITRDARWGRVEETFGEDPYLVSIMGLHYIVGIQGNDWKEGIMATAKHFVGYGLSEGGMNWAPVHIPPREMQEVFLLPFEVAVKEAKVAAIMPAYHELDGIPCHSSTELLRDILRQQWGFDGLVVSDYFAINMLKETHLIASNKENAARLAIEAGVDIELPSTDCYGKPLKDLLQKGKIDEQLINESVARILKKKFLLGIFNNPSVDENKSSKVFDTPKQRNLAHRIAQESIVLLKNENNILPLKKGFSSISVIGPNAHSARNIIGDYAYPCHIESLLDMKKDDKFNTPIPSKVEMDNNFIPILTVLEGIKEKVNKDTKIFYAEGCAVLDDSRAGFSEALEYVRKAEVAIVVVGDKSGLIDDCTSGETRDRASLNLPGVQEELIKEIHKTGTPIILVLINGRPLSINWAARYIPAIIEAWLPGEEGARAIADVLFGDYNPGGKLPISFPRSVGQVPVYYNHKPSGGRSHWKEDYVEMSSKPLFPFGHGLSYTNFEYSNMVITPRTVSRDSQVKISVDIKNIGSSTGDEVIQLYVHNRQSTITRPLKELKGFKRITLKPGKKKTVYFILLSEQLGFYNKEFKYVVEPATVKVMIGSSSEHIRLVDEYEIIE
ncbi:MAG: glycoside hydrolase family 3 N-terminal domain-containing protein [Atribacterota bacterium]|nr:glycoside hydrolase family 3 N-terminal domain-containing protein [Atribacterota bacterium]MDD4896202.1 glycoside hydrolase family 3 N-terminal domain-containing protein [Atribacterota bacterium]MDD5636805.1 glycoside hydrolase family 3 N-terminal domain-containing protein [Atribacterota bacterium]